MEEVKKFAEAYLNVSNFIGYAAGVAVGIGGEIGKKLEENAIRALNAVRIIRPLSAAEMDMLRYEESEKLLKNGQIGQIMCRSEEPETAGAE